MKLSTLLNLLDDVDYVITTQSGTELERGFASKLYGVFTQYPDYKVIGIKTANNCDKIFIGIK